MALCVGAIARFQGAGARRCQRQALILTDSDVLENEDHDWRAAQRVKEGAHFCRLLCVYLPTAVSLQARVQGLRGRSSMRDPGQSMPKPEGEGGQRQIDRLAKR